MDWLETTTKPAEFYLKEGAFPVGEKKQRGQHIFFLLVHIFLKVKLWTKFPFFFFSLGFVYVNNKYVNNTENLNQMH